MTSVLYEQSDRIVTLTLNRADTRNALSADVIEGLVGGLKRANADRSVSCVIITGAGKSFCSGGNLHEMSCMTTTWKLTPPEPADWARNGIQPIPPAFHHLD